MVKNQHLLLSLAALGVINLWVLWSLVLGERTSARGLDRVGTELASAKEDHRRVAEGLEKETEELRSQLKSARSTIGELQSEVERLGTSLGKARKSLEAVEERLKKLEPKEKREKE